jgi:molecular chaperone DnaK
MIERNTTIPSKKSQIFSTASDGQTQVDVHVLQGEREMASYNKSLGNFILDGIAPAPRGVPQIEVTFDIDANGIVHVTAKDMGTGREQKITITASTNMTEAQIKEAVKEAELHAAEDAKRKEEIEIKNHAETSVYQTEKTLNELGDKVDAADRATVEEALARLKTAISSNSTEDMKTETEAVQQAFYKVSEKLYSQQKPGEEQAQPQPEDFTGYSEPGAGPDSEGFKNAGGDF